MSNNLDLDQVAENQALKEVTINTATGQLDAALTEYLVVDLTAGNATVTSSNYRTHISFLLDNVATSGRTVTLPAVKKLSLFTADAGNSNSVAIVKGATSYAVSPGDSVIAYTDGSTNGLVIISSASGSAGKPYDVGTSLVGLATASERIVEIAFVRTVDFPASMAGSVCKARVAATASTDFDIRKNNTSFGTIRFAAAGTVATYVSIAATSFASGDVLSIIASATPDATLADIGFMFAGNRP